MSIFEALLALIAFCVFLAAIAQRFALPVAVPLVLGGMGLALIPGLPAIDLDPALIMALLLPPLLQISAYNTDWPAFKSNLRPILLLAIGAVFFTAAMVAVVAHALIPHMPWWAAIALGAIVAPPDAVAATSVLKQFKLPKRIVTVLEGESLINDASSLVLYRFAVAAVALDTVNYGSGVLQFAGVALGGALVGWIVGHVAIRVFAAIDDTLLDIAVSLLAGYAAYLIAESVHASGVLGAVACGLVLGRKQHAEFTARTRLELNAVWNFVEFLLASLAFMLIGLELRGVIERLTDMRFGDLLRSGCSIAAVVIASRFAWVYACERLPRLASKRLTDADAHADAANAADAATPWRHAAVLSWAGMRGVVSIAAAIALPQDFPSRDIIVFLAFSSIFATLVLQGTTLGWLIRRLDVVEDDTMMAEPGTVKVRARAGRSGAGCGAPAHGDRRAGRTRGRCRRDRRRIRGKGRAGRGRHPRRGVARGEARGRAADATRGDRSGPRQTERAQRRDRTRRTIERSASSSISKSNRFDARSATSRRRSGSRSAVVARRFACGRSLVDPPGLDQLSARTDARRTRSRGRSRRPSSRRSCRGPIRGSTRWAGSAARRRSGGKLPCGSRLSAAWSSAAGAITPARTWKAAKRYSRRPTSVTRCGCDIRNISTRSFITGSSKVVGE